MSGFDINKVRQCNIIKMAEVPERKNLGGSRNKKNSVAEILALNSYKLPKKTSELLLGSLLISNCLIIITFTLFLFYQSKRQIGERLTDIEVIFFF